MKIFNLRNVEITEITDGYIILRFTSSKTYGFFNFAKSTHSETDMINPTSHDVVSERLFNIIYKYFLKDEKPDWFQVENFFLDNRK